MQGLFVYVGGLAILALWRINGSAQRQFNVAGHYHLFFKGHFPVFSLALPGMPATPW
jgi:hypothetical protein